MSTNPFSLIASGRMAILAILVVGVLSLVAGAGTMAFYSTTAASTANVFVAGTIDLDLADANETVTDSVTASIGAANTSWRPGQKAYGPIDVISVGTLGLMYGLSYSAVDSGTQPDPPGGNAALTQFLSLTIKKAAVKDPVVAKGDCISANWEDADYWTQTPVLAALTLAPHAVDSAHVVWALDSDDDRPLDAAGGTAPHELLCLQVEYTNGGEGAENAGMGGTSTIVFTFGGKQLP